MTLTHNVAVLGILMHLFKTNIPSMSGMLFLMFVQSLFQYGAKGGMGGLLQGENGVKGGRWEGCYREKNYFYMCFFFELRRIYNQQGQLDLITPYFGGI